jgi:hypothetical protein
LSLATSTPDRTTVGREGFNPIFFDGSGFGTQTNSIDTGFIGTRLHNGARYEVGMLVDDLGWLVSGFITQSNTQEHVGTNVGMSFFSPLTNGVGALESFVDATGPLGVPDGIDDDLNGNNIFGRFGEDIGTPNANPPPAFIPPLDGIPDIPAPVDFGDLAFLPVYFDHVRVKSSTRAWGIEISGLRRVYQFARAGNWEFIGGVRYLRFRDEFFVDARGKILDPGTAQERILGVLADSRWDTDADNNLVGPQIGIRFSNSRGRFTLTAEARFMAAGNFQSVRMRGYIANPPIDENGSSPPANASPVPIQPTPTSPTLIGRPINLFPEAFNYTMHATEFSPAAEMRVEAGYRIFESVTLEAGFTYFFADNIARSANMIDYTLPAMGILTGNNRDNDLGLFGYNLGISLSR